MTEGADRGGRAARRRTIPALPRAQRADPGDLRPGAHRWRAVGLAASGGFVTGVAGMGHVAITTKKPHQMRGYYSTVFDARLSVTTSTRPSAA